MSTQALRRPLRVAAARSRALEAVIAVLLAAVAAGAAWYLEEHGSLRGVAVAGLVVVLLWLAITMRTQVALVFFMIYLGAFDGYLKLRTGADVVTLVRDALLFAIVVGVLVRAQVTGARLNAPPL